ncbi:hypothetical protein HDU98_005373 [Podochytrium sp. JEL0797]|nr:hypothetical protein HDU98_005373 [Podochytrium sp. JEL0797]
MATAHTFLVIHRVLAEFTPPLDLLHLLSTCKYLSNARHFAISNCSLMIPVDTPVKTIETELGRLLPHIRILSFTGMDEVEELFVVPYRHILPLCSTSLTAEMLLDGNLLSRFTNLQHLDITGVDDDLEDKLAVKKIGASVSAQTQGSTIKELKSISALTQLTTLKLDSAAELRDFGPLVTLTKLRVLDLSRTHFTDTSLLTQELSLEMAVGIVSLEHLKSLINLENLCISATHANSLAPLSKMAKLRQLVCHDTDVSDISVLAKLPNLVAVHLSNTFVEDIGPLASLEKLEILEIAGTGVDDLKPIAKLTNLKELDIDEISVRSLKLLKNLVNLETLEYDTERVGLNYDAKWMKKIKNVNPLKRAFAF